MNHISVKQFELEITTDGNGQQQVRSSFDASGVAGGEGDGEEEGCGEEQVARGGRASLSATGGSMQRISVTRYDNPAAVGWAGYIEPEDGSWIAFIDLAGVPVVFLNRSATGAVL